MTITLPSGTRAFYFYAEPNVEATFKVTATASGTTSGAVSVSGNGGAKYFGFYTKGGTTLTSIKVTSTTSGETGFAIGEFAIAFKGVPSKPAAPTATAGNTTATVSWVAPTANGTPISSYTVTSTPGAKTCTTSGLSCAVGTLTNGVAYTFQVKAHNTVGTSPTSTPSNSVTPKSPATVPGKPATPTAMGATKKAKVSWAKDTATNGAKITKYTVTSSTGTHTCSPTTLTAATLSCTVTGLTNGATYTFTVKAHNAPGTSAPSTPSNPVIPAQTVVTCPTGKSCTATATNPTTGTSATVTSTSGAKTVITVNFGTTLYPLLGCTSAGFRTIVNWTGNRTVTLVYTETKVYKTVKTPFRWLTFCYGGPYPFLTGKLRISTYNPKNKEYEGTLPVCIITLFHGPCIESEAKTGTSQIYTVLSGPGTVPKGGGSGPKGGGSG